MSSQILLVYWLYNICSGSIPYRYDGVYFVVEKSPIRSIMKSDQTIIRKNHMEPLHFITKLLDIKDPNIKIVDIINKNTHKEIIAKLDYDAPSCPDCGTQMKKYDFQKPSKIPCLEMTGMPTRILLKKRRFKCYQCSKTS